MEFFAIDTKYKNELVELFYETFKYSENEEEAKIVSGLVASYLENFPRNDLKGYCAIENGKVVGAVFFSKLDFSDKNVKVFILSPMAVSTDFQGKGIGQSLINFAHNELKTQGVSIVVTYGDINFYSKVGYQHITVEQIVAPFELTFPEGWLAHALDGITPLKLEGRSRCIPELNDKNLW